MGQKMLLTVPSKTFIFGEYLALESGPSLLLATGPRFSFQTNEGSNFKKQIHPLSAAGKFINLHQESFKSLNANFIDPHKAQGGFGASGAQFVFSYLYKQIKEQQNSDYDVWTIWKSFKDHAHQSKGYTASGADIVTQLLGGVNLFNPEDRFAQKLAWPFKKKSFFVVRTGKKIPTHDHLSELQSLPIVDLKIKAEQATKAFKVGQWDSFKLAVQGYYDCLVDHELVCDYSKKLVHQISGFRSVELVKSCGALGADTLLVFYDLSLKDEAQQNILNLGLDIVSSEVDEVGLEIGEMNE